MLIDQVTALRAMYPADDERIRKARYVVRDEGAPGAVFWRGFYCRMPCRRCARRYRVQPCCVRYCANASPHDKMLGCGCARLYVVSFPPPPRYCSPARHIRPASSPASLAGGAVAGQQRGEGGDPAVRHAAHTFFWWTRHWCGPLGSASPRRTDEWQR
jgi:hypothetical protein